MSRRSRRALSLALLMGVLGAAVSVVQSPASYAAGDSGSYRSTKTLTRTFVDGGSERVVDSRKVTVQVDHTTQLQGRERMHISWSGAHPSAARASDPFGENGLQQEYPVVILQCRGVDDPKLPAAKQISPSTCWTSTRTQRSQSLSPSAAVWTHDLYASDADRQPKSGMDPFPAEACNDVSMFDSHITPFVAASGKVFTSCNADTMAPEAAVGSSFPPAEQAAYTGTDGKGQTDFEVRSTVENESLGCSRTVACSVVVIPIMGISCADDDAMCRQTGSFAPGSSNFTNDGVDAAVSPLYWWSASNWRNRFSVPVSFALPPGVCDVLDSRAPTAFYGSELLSQAALQWAPAYCLRKDRFKWQQNNMPDDAAFQLMEDGTAAAAEVSGKRELDGSDPVAYAPTAVTGFAISYVIDRPGNKGEFSNLRLDARLLAKLLTQSYPASGRGQGHPGLAKNPISMNLDPEFKKLNPGLSTIDAEAAATVMSLSTSSDVIKTLTSYLAQDPDAVAFMAGKADPWGMRINPSYKGLKLPLSQWPSKDTYVPPSNLECYKANPAPYLPQVAAPVNNLRSIATAVLDSWPLTATKCDRSVPTDPWKLGRIDRQASGSRFLLGVTTLGDAHRFGLHTASLQAAPGHFVAPDDKGLAAAIALGKSGTKKSARKGAQKAAQGDLPLVIDQLLVRRSASAYPGTMVVYTAARTHGLSKADAAKVASFIRISSTQGQQAGRGNGQLPAGYLPITSSGVTSALYKQAQRVATAVATQKAPRAAKAHGGKGGGGGVNSPTAASGSSVQSGADAGSAAAAPKTTPVTAVAAKTSEPESAISTVRTALVSAGAGGWLLPVLLGLGLTGLVLTGFSRFVLRSRGVR